MSWRARAERSLGISQAAPEVVSACPAVPTYNAAAEPDHAAVRDEAYQRGLEASGRALPRDCAPAEWIAGIGRLRCAPPPDGASRVAWVQLLDGCEHFLRHWGRVAAAQGWTAGELFSLHPTAPLGRLDQRGAAFMVGSGKVTAVTASTIRMRPATCASDLTLHRRWLNPGPAAWQHFGNLETPHD